MESQGTNAGWVRILPQPDDTTCGPTCLHALYAFHGDAVDLDRLVREIVPLDSRGTLAVLLAHHALRRGYSATIYTYNLHVFDPTWFGPDGGPAEDGGDRLRERMRAQAEQKAGDARLRFATEAYLEFLQLGGELRFRDLTPALLRKYLEAGRPLLTGLSATYLYRCARERGEQRLVYDDIGGVPTGHFVILSGYDPVTEEVLVADPLGENPAFQHHYYRVGIHRVIAAILLGVITYDANFLVVEPRRAGAGGAKA